jgi:hypothetical protein
MRLRIFVSVITLALLVTAANGTPANLKYSYGWIQRTCAPWDGAAIGITLATKPVECKRTPAFPYINMGVWKGLPIHDGQVVKFTAISDIGFASRCSNENNCERAESGEITFDTFKEGTSAAGRYELHFKGGDVVSGKFDVKWCEFREFCG